MRHFEFAVCGGAAVVFCVLRDSASGQKTPPVIFSCCSDLKKLPSLQSDLCCYVADGCATSNLPCVGGLP